MRLLFIALLTLTASIAWGHSRITVRDSSEMSGSGVTIGAIADVRCDDPATACEVESVEVCPAPLAGSSRRISRDQIAVALRRCGFADGSFQLDCPATVTVTRESVTLTGSAMFEAARDHVLTNGVFEGDVIVEIARLPADKTVPAGGLELRPRTAGTRLRKGRNTVPVDIVTDGRVHSTVYLSLDIRTFGQVLVATQAIARGDEITSHNVELKTCELTRLPNDVCCEPPSNAFTARMPIAAGAVVRRASISPIPVIRTGDAVTVTASGDFISVSDKGVAASDGCIGDRIRIRLGTDKRTVRAKVTGPRAVQITLGGGE